MNRTLLFGIVVFFAVLAMAFVGGEQKSLAGHGCHGCAGVSCDGGGCGGGCGGRRHHRHHRRGCCGEQAQCGCCGAPAQCGACGSGMQGGDQGSPSDAPAPAPEASNRTLAPQA